jgi:hypothetical protein
MASKFYYSTNGNLSDTLPAQVNFAVPSPSLHIKGAAPSAVEFDFGGSGVSYGGNTPSSDIPNPSTAWYPSAAIFQDDPYYIRNSLLSPNSMKPRVPEKTFPNEKNGLFSSAEGSDPFIPDNRIDDRYSSV